MIAPVGGLTFACADGESPSDSPSKRASRTKLNFCAYETFLSRIASREARVSETNCSIVNTAVVVRVRRAALVALRLLLIHQTPALTRSLVQ